MVFNCSNIFLNSSNKFVASNLALLSSKNLNELPDLSKYTNLEILYCYENKLTKLPKLPQLLVKLYSDIVELENELINELLDKTPELAEEIKRRNSKFTYNLLMRIIKLSNILINQLDNSNQENNKQIKDILITIKTLQHNRENPEIINKYLF